MKYISLFSGIGGLEHSTKEPIVYVEQNPACISILNAKAKNNIEIHKDIRGFNPPKADAVIGGWPCQDISVAGKKAGLAGTQSSLFYEMVRVAKQSGAETIIGENVPRAHTNTEIRQEIEKTLKNAGFLHIEWRILNARSFGLPHQRSRAFIVASHNPRIANALKRPLPSITKEPVSQSAAAFYWTAGTHSICYSNGYCPTLKIGSGLAIPSPPAVFINGIVRKLSPDECLKLQGFNPKEFENLKASDIYRVSGNAVARPVGAWVVACLDCPEEEQITQSGLAENLGDFLLPSTDSLSIRAASGLLRRLQKSGKPCPDLLRAALTKISIS